MFGRKLRFSSVFDRWACGRAACIFGVGSAGGQRLIGWRGVDGSGSEETERHLRHVIVQSLMSRLQHFRMMYLLFVLSHLDRR